MLAAIGRRHTHQDFIDCYNTAKEMGFKSINTDLIAGLPKDTVEGFENSLKGCIGLGAENITVHTLTLKRASNIVVNHEDNSYSDVSQMLEKCTQLAQNGYVPYYMYRQKNTVGNFENVGFALEGAEGRYNVYMMEEVHSIFAVGAGAVSKMVNYRPQNGGKPVINRLFYPKYPYEYLKDESVEEKIAEMERFYLSEGLL